MLQAARSLFGRNGFAEVSTGDIATLAGVSKGGLYHQFPSKTAIFEAVVLEAESEMGRKVGKAVARESEPVRAIQVALEVFLDGYADPITQRIVLVDGPAVLGWSRWRAICLEQGSSVLLQCLESAHAHGLLPQAPTEALVHLLLGALDEAVLFVAASDDKEHAKADVMASVSGLILGPAALG